MAEHSKYSNIDSTSITFPVFVVLCHAGIAWPYHSLQATSRGGGGGGGTGGFAPSPTFIKGGQSPRPPSFATANHMLKIMCSSALSSHIKHGEVIIYYYIIVCSLLPAQQLVWCC
jgi:hypothetical protein